MSPNHADRERKKRILEGVRGQGLEQAAADPLLRRDMEAEADSDDPKKLVNHDLLAVADAARQARRAGPSLSLFFSTADVILLPGLLGSQLEDASGGNGLIWIDPKLVFDTGKLLALALAPGSDDDATSGVAIRPNGAVPIIYAGLRAALEVSRYHVQEIGFDWRKHVDVSANAVADVIRDRANNRPRPLHLIAHSQGSLVARRALQLLGPDLGRRLVDNLVLLGPATAGSFSAAFGIAGTHEFLDTVQRYGIVPPDGFAEVLQSMSGLYQLLPWRMEPVDGAPADKAIEWVRANFPPSENGPVGLRDPAAWRSGVDARRLAELAGWGATIDASYLNDRTTIILGDQPTVGGAMFDAAGKLVPDPDFATVGDGTVPESMARIVGVTRVFKATGAEHMMLPATWAVIVAVRDVLAGRTPAIEPAMAAALAARPSAPPRLRKPPPPAEFFGVPRKPTPDPARPPAAPVPHAPPVAPTPGPARMADVSPPPSRRLRVFSFDPLFGSDLGNLGVAQVTVELPWEFADGGRLLPGPVGEYLEVVDFDSSSRCFYPPVDLNHPHLLAQDGIPISEGDPRFHQQMAYAVAMNTIRHFEVALGRAALWAPNLRRDPFGSVIPPERSGDEYVGRLRIYPHAMREQNAYYSPEKKALLFGYFPADGQDVGGNLPGGIVFSCLSYDVVAHETTHALLDGLHRYFIQPSNPDVFAFHEAFADVVALLQHFSHPEVLRHQIAKTRGDVEGDSSLGDLAAQFGEATGHRGALRQYLRRAGEDGKPAGPDREAVRKETEPHKRGAILVAAVFRAFANIYENRVKDLRRIATGGTGLLPPGDLHPDMVSRLADEAAKAARHLLRMCVRALDYAPPVDLTFGEYLRALVTADYDLVRDDDLRYRVSVVSAFRDWGIYPSGVRSLSVDSLLWNQPERQALTGLRDFFEAAPFDDWGLSTDRRAAYLRMCEHNARFHEWLADPKHLPPVRADALGLCLDPTTAPGGIRRDAQGRPVFQVYMFRPCRRIGPDGQELTDVVVEVIQRRMGLFDEARQAEVDALTGEKWTEKAYKAIRPDFFFRGGCTLIIDPKTGTVRYAVCKPIKTKQDERLAEERKFRQGQFRGEAAVFLGPRGEDNPFEALHADH